MGFCCIFKARNHIELSGTHLLEAIIFSKSLPLHIQDIPNYGGSSLCINVDGAIICKVFDVYFFNYIRYFIKKNKLRCSQIKLNTLYTYVKIFSRHALLKLMKLFKNNMCDLGSTVSGLIFFENSDICSILRKN